MRRARAHCRIESRWNAIRKDGTARSRKASELERYTAPELLAFSLLLQIGRHLRRRFGRSARHLVEDSFKILESRRRNNNRVATPVDILGNAQKTAARIFLQSKNESLAFDLHLVGSQRVLDDTLFWTSPMTMPVSMSVPVRVLMRTVAVGRWTFIRYHTLFPNSFPRWRITPPLY